MPAVLGDLVTREITWIGSYRFIDEITDAVQALHEGLDLAPLITHTFKIDQAARRSPSPATGDPSGKVMLQLTDRVPCC